MDRYRFILKIDEDYHTVTPSFSNFKQDHEREGNSVVLKEIFSGTINFFGKDYHLLLPFEQGISRCNAMILIIYRYCADEYVEFIKGKLLLNNGEWDLHKCMVKLKVESASTYHNFEQNKDQEVNVLGVGLQTVELVYGAPQVIATEVICGSRISNFKYYDIEICPELSDTTYSIQKIDITGRTSIGSDNVKVTWVKPTTGTKLFTFLNPNRSSAPTLPNGDIKEVQTFEFDYLGSANFRSNTRFRRLNDLLTYFVGTIFNLGIKSNFFQINPDLTSNINYVTEAPTEVAHLLIAQVTDVQRPNSTSAATIVTITWEKLWNDLVTFFNLDFTIEDNTFIIEHVSFFQNRAIQDLTNAGPAIQKWLVGLENYHYDNEKQFPEESWEMHNTFKKVDVLTKFDMKDHKGVNIYYNNGCVEISRGERKKVWKTEVISADIYSILSGPTLVNCNGEIYEKDPTTKDGLVLIAAEQVSLAQYNMLSSGAILSDNIEPNNCLSIAHIQNNYFRHNRSFQYGYMNNKLETFKSTVKAKIGKEFVLPYCCDELLNLRNPIKTSLGNGEIVKSSYDLQTGLITLSLAYPTDDYEIPQEQAPFAREDSFSVGMELSTVLDVLANDVNTDDSSIEIVQEPLNGIVTLIGNEVRYKGNIGYINAFPAGLPKEIFSYRLKKGSIYSNTAEVSLTVVSRANPFIAKRDLSDGVTDDYYTLSGAPSLIVTAAEGVLANDIFYNVNGTINYQIPACLAFVGLSNEGGAVNLQTNGSFSYTPVNPTYQGIDYFEYIAVFVGYSEQEYSIYKKATVRILVENPSETHAFGEIINTRSQGRGITFGDLSIALYYDAAKKYPKKGTLSVNVQTIFKESRQQNVVTTLTIQFNNEDRVVFDRNVLTAYTEAGQVGIIQSLAVGTLPGNNYIHHEPSQR